MKDLQPFVDKIWAASELEEKRKICLEMIKESHATTATKKRSQLTAMRATSPEVLDRLATNYSLAGQGLKVI
ncbi:MAG: hypothetical protein EBU90_26250 [Proteobacteria bacterium]|nr:hypothetical protein [Pseudomonadota bacterium]